MTVDAFKLDRDPGNGFLIIGNGSLGGKARGLIFLEGLLRKNRQLDMDYPGVEIAIPPTLIIASDAFDAFMQENDLGHLRRADLSDAEMVRLFLAGHIPADVRQCLAQYLFYVDYPLAVRSSGLLEDAKNHAYAGLYSTYMLSNDQSDAELRLDRLLQAMKRIYASTFFKGPRAYAKRVGHDISNDGMAVVVQQVAGVTRGQHCYPDISGVAQSRNHYPLSGIKPEDGLATIALGLGKKVVSGERALRFSPKHPHRLPQCTTVEEVMAYTQRRFYSLPMGDNAPLEVEEHNHLVRRQISSVLNEVALTALVATYVLAEHRIRDTAHIPGPKVLTFPGILKYNQFPLAALLQHILDLGQDALNGPVEIEFAVNLPSDQRKVAQFYLLQMRPMTARAQGVSVTIHSEERRQALCYTRHAMGNGNQTLSDIVYVKPEAFDPSRTRDVAAQVAQINARLEQRKQHYLLIGPGRWGSADPWLGIPVRWADISYVGAIVETASEKLKAEPSQGAHFFHNLTALGISYLGVTQRAPDLLDWPWLLAQPKHDETDYVAHVRIDQPLMIKVDGRTSQGVVVNERRVKI